MNNYPQLPLSAEFTAALQALPETRSQEDVRKLRRQFHEWRERLFPGYIEQWNREVAEWAKQA